MSIRRTSRAQARAAAAARVAVALLAGLAIGGPATGHAQAQDQGAMPHDGLHGRFDGDVVLSLAMGGGVAGGGDPGSRAFIGGDARARYLDTAGLVLGVESRPGAFGVATTAVELRPLFPALFLLDLASGSPFWDLLVGSIGVELGAALLPLGRGMGAALHFATGLDVPIVPPQGTGPFAHGLVIHLMARHLRAGARDSGGPGALAEWSFGAALTLRFAADTGLAARPTGPRPHRP